MTATFIEPVIETRSGEMADVNLPKRIVTCIVMPYEQPATIYEQNRSYEEIVSRSAFAGVETQPKRIKANREHVPDKLVGKVIALHPSRSEGLVAEVRMFTTDDGAEALTLCDEGGLDVSAGFGLLRSEGGKGPVYPDAETWERNGAVRRLNKLYLHHVAFVANPAHPGAVVQNVRHAALTPQEPAGGELAFVSTPNRDQLALAVQRAEKARLDALYLNR
jgi:phage head maturation protease